MGRPPGERSKRFAHISKSIGECVYVAEFSTGIVKIGYSRHPAKRLKQIDEVLARKNAGSIARFAIGGTFANHLLARSAEKSLINELARIATPVPGTREYFTGIAFDDALAVVRAAIPA